MKTLPILVFGIIAIILFGLFAIVSDSVRPHTLQQACTQEAKICPDGSAVGRTGPNCEFAECSSSSVDTATSVTLHAALGEGVIGLNTTVSPLEVMGDSRCPKDVQCIWAGTVKVRTKISDAAGENEIVLELGSATTSNAIQITLSDVSPPKNSGETIPVSNYRFTFNVEKK